MKRLALLGGSVILAAVMTACQEKLTTPADCPELCPGTGLLVRDTVLIANIGGDTSFAGFVGPEEQSALLVSNGINAGEARAFAAFPRRIDSTLVSGVQTAIRVDSVAISVILVARDSVVPGVKLFYYRVSPDLDTNSTFSEVDGALDEAHLIDSLAVPDTLKVGTLRLVLSGADLAKLATPAADSGRLGLGLRVRASEPTGVRLGSLLSTVGGPVVLIYGRADVADTALQKQTLSLFSTRSNYVIDVPPVTGVDRIYVGGKFGARLLLRFTIPRGIRDSATVLRATLELTPATPLRGLRNDDASIQIRGLLTDIGAKSPALAGVSGGLFVKAGETGVQSAEIRNIVTSWFGATNVAPTAMFMAISPEGGTFSRPEFFSTRAASGAPRLRITYAIPSRPGHP